VNQYHRFVNDLARLVKRAGRHSPKPAKGSWRHKPSATAPRALIFSPHPDDECAVGALALRLLREARWNVFNVAVTLGSKRQRRAGRLRELKNACGLLEFGLIIPSGKGLENINPTACKGNPKKWEVAVNVIADILVTNQPRVIFIPHDGDGHETHIGTHQLVMDALRKMPAQFQCYVVETEFWAQMQTPNLLVEVGATELGALVTALSLHAGEVKRNAYHLRLPAWMMDNVRRSETVSGHGSAAPDFSFATIYRLSKWKAGKLANVLKRGKLLSCPENAGLLFP
jgi:LmbE family N-acetylglucosaminyl deacetylase